MRYRATVAFLILTLAACDQTAAPTRAGAAPNARKSPAPTKSKLPLQAASAAPDGPDVLRAPSRTAVALRGRIGLDARYAVGTGLISDQGSGLISDRGGGLLAVKGAELLSNNSGNLVSRDPAGIISHHGAGLTAKVKLISDQGGGLISNNGGSLVSDQGGGLVSNNGGGLVSNNGGGAIARFGLLTASPLPVAAQALPHAALPVAGMLMGVLSLADGAYLPLGIDRDGKPIYAIYTNSRGEFAVHLPAARARNVLVVSSVPGTDDPRLAVDLVASSAAAQDLLVNDGSTVLTTYLRRAIVARFEEALDPDPCRPKPASLSTASYGFSLAVLAYEDAFDATFKALPRPARVRVLQRLTDAAIADLDLPNIDIMPALAERSQATGRALPVLQRMLAEIEAAAAQRLEASPTYFDDKPYTLIANRERGTGPAFTIRKPTDFSEMVVSAFLTTNDIEVMRRFNGVLVDIGLSPTLQEDMKAAGGSLFAALGQLITSDDSAQRLREVIRLAIAEEAGATDAPLPCVPTGAPPGREADTATLAGTGEAGGDDGPGATARFDRPSRLLYDPRGALIVSEGNGQRLRRIDLKDPTHPVTTLAGTGEAGWLDGPARQAKFSGPSGLALDAQGALYVAERGNHRIRKITDWDGTAPMVSTLAGDGTPGHAEGSGAAARFNAPEDVTFGPDGALWVADTQNHRVRRVSLDGVVSTFAGSDDHVPFDAIGPAAAFDEPRGLAFGPDGHLFVVDSKAGRLRLVGPKAEVGLFAGRGGEGFTDGNYFTATFNMPFALGLSALGEIFLADTRHHRIRVLDKQGFVATLAGSGPGGKEAGGYAEGRGAAAAFNSPEGLAVAPDGTIYVADTRNHRIRVLTAPKP